jgi:UDP-GlcNAc:undecaprenyl-phosphate/decaprenyl-phosphate GlcNAc-1-phosphate transferase
MNFISANQLLFGALLAFFLVLLELLYLRLARKHEIFSAENERSSHSGHAIIGGGLIFFLSFLIYSVLSNFPYPNILIGTFLLALISFIDDLGYVKHSYRLLVHLLALTLMIPEMNIGQYGYFFALCLITLGVGVLNSFNFIDGINGMLGTLALVILFPIYYINYFDNFIDPNLILAIIISVIIFLIFNFRKNAICFAGDVGSVVIGYLLFILIISLCLFKYDYFYLLLFCVPGAEAGLTLLFRILGGNNILLPHKTFLFHILITEAKHSHLKISIIYGLIQLIINFFVIYLADANSLIKLIFFFAVIFLLTLTYLILRNKFLSLEIKLLKK